jgi:hypothetical protein
LVIEEMGKKRKAHIEKREEEGKYHGATQMLLKGKGLREKQLVSA